MDNELCAYCQKPYINGAGWLSHTRDKQGQYTHVHGSCEAARQLDVKITDLEPPDLVHRPPEDV